MLYKLLQVVYVQYLFTRSEYHGTGPVTKGENPDWAGAVVYREEGKAQKAM